jgi:undecaprenyl diphosphate synthase
MGGAKPELDQIAPPGSPGRALLDQLDLDRLPRHVAIIMDGNGRWAEARHLPRGEGHRAGIRTLLDTVETAARLGIEVMTLYAFSTENWKRPRAEVRTLMGLLKEYIDLELDRFAGNNLQLRPIGRLDQLDRSVRAAVEKAVERTAACTGPVVQVALNYSGRQELTELIRDAAQAAAGVGLVADEIDEKWVGDHLSTRGLPDPDLLIRTSGEQRLSNFLLWQIAYAEIYFTPVLWPDFSTVELLRALLEYQRRDRRFGGLPPSGGGMFTPQDEEDRDR